jgi:hypothetical protein
MQRYCTQSVKIEFPNKVFLGSEYYIHIPGNYGSAISKIRVVLDLKTVQNTQGEKIIKEAEIINTHEKLYGEFMYIKNTLDIPIEKNEKYTENTRGAKVYIDLPFYSITKMLFSQSVDLRILLNSGSTSEEIVGYLLVDFAVTESLPTFPFFQRIRKVHQLSAVFSNCSTATMYTYIPNSVYTLTFTVEDVNTGNYVDAIDNITLFLDDRERFNLSGYYLRYIETLKRYKKSSLDIPIYTYSLCMNPNEINVPSGQSNFPENQRFKFDLFDNQSTYKITIWAETHDFYYITDYENGIRSVFDSSEIVLSTSSSTVNAFNNIPLTLSYSNFADVISISYSGGSVEISNVHVLESNISTQPTISQNEINYSYIDSLNGVYYSNISFVSSGYKEGICNFVFKSPKNFQTLTEPLGTGPYDYYLTGNPIAVIDGSQRINVAYGQTLNGVNVSTNAIDKFTIDQFRNYIVVSGTKVTKFDQTLTDTLYDYTFTNFIVGNIGSYFGTDVIPLTSTTLGSFYNTNTSKYTNITCQNLKVTLNTCEVDSILNIYVSGVTTGTGDIILSNGVTITKGTGKKSFLLKFDQTGTLVYYILCDNSDDTFDTDVKVTSNGAVFTCYSGTGSTFYDFTGNSVSLSNTQYNSIRITKLGSYIHNMSSFTGTPKLVKTAVDLFDNFYIATSAGVSKYNRFGTPVFTTSITGGATFDNWLFDACSNTSFIMLKNKTVTNILETINNTKRNIPANKTVLLCFDTNGVLLSGSTNATSNIFNFVNTPKELYYIPLYVVSYFSNSYSYPFIAETSNIWNISIQGKGSTSKVLNNDVYFSGKAYKMSNVFNSTVYIPQVIGDAAFVIKANNTTSEPSWLAYIDGPDTDVATGVTVSSSGKVYCSGYTTGTATVYSSSRVPFGTIPDYSTQVNTSSTFILQLSSSGNPEWFTCVSNVIYAPNTISGTSVADSSNNSYMITTKTSNSKIYDSSSTPGGPPTGSLKQFTNNSSDGCGVIKYNSLGKVDKVSSYNVFWCESKRIVYGESNLISVSVTSSTSSSNYVYDSDGVGRVPLKNTNNRTDYPTDSCIVKYNSDLFAHWTAGVVGCNINGLCVDNLSNVYACGQNNPYRIAGPSIIGSNGSTLSIPNITGSSDSAVMCKFDTNGIAKWSVQMSTNSSNFTACVCDSSRNIYVCGNKGANTPIATIYNRDGSSTLTVPANTGDRMGICIKYNSDGFAQWRIYYDGVGIDETTFVSIDSNDNIILSGYYAGKNVKFYDLNDGEHMSYQPDTSGDIVGFCVKYNSNGFLVHI